MLTLAEAEPAAADDPLAAPFDPDDPGRRWWVLRTRPRAERRLAGDLAEAGVEHYLPIAADRRRNNQGYPYTRLAPLFPSYLFLLGDRASVGLARRTRRALTHVEVADQRRLHFELQSIAAMIATGRSITPEPQNTPGTLVRVVSGPLAGSIGTIVERSNGDRLVLWVAEVLGGASVTVEGWQVEPVGT